MDSSEKKLKWSKAQMITPPWRLSPNDEGESRKKYGNERRKHQQINSKGTLSNVRGLKPMPEIWSVNKQKKNVSVPASYLPNVVDYKFALMI